MKKAIYKKLMEIYIRLRRPSITVLILHWNRSYMLKRTVDTLIKNSTLPNIKFIIIDNGSTDDTKEVINSINETYKNLEYIFFPKNMGGEALNEGFKKCKSDFIYISENDLEYILGWDMNLIMPFYMYPNLGQLSPFSPFHKKEEGEIWEEKPATHVSKIGIQFYKSDHNVGTSCMIRKEVVQKGVRWQNIKQVEGNKFLFPNDFQFSHDIRAIGFDIGWSMKYNALNWGHNIEEFNNNIDYYRENYQAKSGFGMEGWEKRLENHGYKLGQKKIHKK